MSAVAVERVAEIFSLISLAVLSLVPIFFYFRNRIRRMQSRSRDTPRNGEGAPQRTAQQPERTGEPERREPRLFEQATIVRREQARARIAEAEAGAPRYRGRAARRIVGWGRIDTLPPLKRAVILSEILGRPRGLPDEGPGEF
jgi:hypothetical protein